MISNHSQDPVFPYHYEIAFFRVKISRRSILTYIMNMMQLLDSNTFPEFTGVLYKRNYGDVFRLQKLNEICRNTRTSSGLNTSAWSRNALHCIFSCMTTKKNFKKECLVRRLKFRKFLVSVMYSTIQHKKQEARELCGSHKHAMLVHEMVKCGQSVARDSSCAGVVDIVSYVQCISYHGRFHFTKTCFKFI